MAGHMLYVTARLYDEDIRLILDSGCGVNVLNMKALKKGKTTFVPTRLQRVQGITGSQKIKTIGWLRELQLESQNSDGLEVMLTDLSDMNRTLKVKVDGILGIPFLVEHKTAINYQRKKMYRWQDTSVVPALAKNEEEGGKRLPMSGN